MSTQTHYLESFSDERAGIVAQLLVSPATLVLKGAAAIPEQGHPVLPDIYLKLTDFIRVVFPFILVQKRHSSPMFYVSFSF